MIEIREILRSVRENLGLDVAFIAQFVGDWRVFWCVDAAHPDIPIREGDSGPLEGSYCQLVADGRLPGLMADARDNPVASQLAVTHALPVGAHLSVPIRMSDGSIFGTFCCMARTPLPSLNERDRAMLQTFANLTARLIERDMTSDQLRAAKEQQTRSVIASGGPAIVYQPIFRLDMMRIDGAEALSRFGEGAGRTPDVWFKEAAEAGLQVELELAAIRNALREFRDIWETRPIQLGLNASAATILDERLWEVLEGYPRDLIIIELTEHEKVRDYEALLKATQRLRMGGTKLAIDDVGAGYASMRHVLMIRPDILKLDVGLTASINNDDLKTALVSSLKHFADRFNCRVVAEGVETVAELETLRQLRLQAAQGYLLGRPGPKEMLLAHLEAASSPCIVEMNAPRPARSDRKRSGERA